jgi:hypothetical protein
MGVDHCGLYVLIPEKFLNTKKKQKPPKGEHPLEAKSKAPSTPLSSDIPSEG